MRAAGFNVAADCAYLSVVDHESVLDLTPLLIKIPQGIGGGDRLIALRDDIRKIIKMHGIAKVRVLDPETNHRGSYVSFVGRYTIETVILLAAAEVPVDAERISRASVRSKLSLPRTGSLQSHSDSVLSPVGMYWKTGRSVAALAALAAVQE